MPVYPDKELIERSRQGDREAFRELFDRYHSRVLSFLRRYMGDYQKAEDATIEAFHEVYRRLPAYREEGKFLSWVFKIAVNCARMEFRKGAHKKEMPFSATGSEEDGRGIEEMASDENNRPDRQAIRAEVAELLERCIGMLDEKYRMAILLCDVDGMSYEDAARLAGCTKVALGVRLKRAREMLMELMKKRGYYFEE